jgi:hypothetical protein
VLTTYDRKKLAEWLTEMTPEEIAEIRNRQLVRRQAEEEYRASLAMDDPIGTVRIYTGFDDEALLVRFHYSRYPEEEPFWHVFHDYKTESMNDYELRHDKLSSQVCVLTTEQLEMLGLKQ